MARPYYLDLHHRFIDSPAAEGLLWAAARQPWYHDCEVNSDYWLGGPLESVALYWVEYPDGRFADEAIAIALDQLGSLPQRPRTSPGTTVSSSSTVSIPTSSLSRSAKDGPPEMAEPPYYAVIFTSVRTGVEDGYDEMDARMEELASRQPGFLGLESAHTDGSGITVSYWETEEALLDWKAHLEHQEAQRLGRSRWYRSYSIRVAKVERAYGFAADEQGDHQHGPEDPAP